MSSLSEEEIKQLNKQAEIESAKRLATFRLLIGAIDSSPKNDRQWDVFRQNNVLKGSVEEKVFSGVRALMEGINDSPEAHTALIRSLNLAEDGMALNSYFYKVSKTSEGRLLIEKFFQIARYTPFPGR